MLTPFDPVVGDRARFELLWGWVYRFEAYTPAPKRKRELEAELDRMRAFLGLES